MYPPTVRIHPPTVRIGALCETPLGFLDDSGWAVVSWFEDHAPCLALLTNVPVSRRHERDVLGPLDRVPWL